MPPGVYFRLIYRDKIKSHTLQTSAHSSVDLSRSVCCAAVQMCFLLDFCCTGSDVFFHYDQKLLKQHPMCLMCNFITEFESTTFLCVNFPNKQVFCPSDTHTNLSLNIPYLAPEVYTVPFTISDSSSPPRSTFINLPGNADSRADELKRAQGGYGTRA